MALSVSAYELGDRNFKVRIASPAEIPGLEKEYRPRFDLCGSPYSLKINGREVLVPPGLSDEFGIEGVPPGFAEADSGGTFLKIGVGILEKDHDGKYNFYHQYPVRKFLIPEVKKERNRLFFRQTAQFGKYGYEYTKTYTVQPEKRLLKIDYTLKNCGTEKIETSQYNHNFFYLKNNSGDSRCQIRTKFLPVLKSFTGSCFDQEGNVCKNLRTSRMGCYIVSAEPVKAEENEFELCHPEVPFKIRVSGDFPSGRFAVSFKENAYISPEIFLGISLSPGKTLRWQRKYEFVHMENLKNQKSSLH